MITTKKIGYNSGDSIFKTILFASGLIIIVLIILIFFLLIYLSLSSILRFGLKFIISSEWNPVKKEFGAFPFILGTLITSFSAMIIVIPFSLSTSLFIREYAPSFLGTIVSHMVDLLAAIPSVIYGMWGIFVLVPAVRVVEEFLYLHFSFIPIFNALPYGIGLLSAILILVVMTLPYSISVTRDVIAQVPRDLKEGAYALGATKWTVVKKIIIPYCKHGIIGGTTLALGRAFGETMAVTMVIGNSIRLPKSIFDPSNTIASIIANEFNEASGQLHMSSLIQLALILFLISMVINTLGRFVIHKTKIAGSI